MTKEELIQSYYNRIKNSVSPINEINSIINEINGLTYNNSNQTIALTDKNEIVNGIKKSIINETTKARIGGVRITKSYSNNEFLDLISHITNIAQSKLK